MQMAQVTLVQVLAIVSDNDGFGYVLRDGEGLHIGYATDLDQLGRISVVGEEAIVASCK